MCRRGLGENIGTKAQGGAQAGTLRLGTARTTIIGAKQHRKLLSKLNAWGLMWGRERHLKSISLIYCVFIEESGGQSGIRTHGELSPTAVFKTAALNHSAICPGPGLVGLGGSGQVTLWGRTLRNSDGGRP